MRKFAIVGIGHVGATIAYTLVTKGIADELVLIDKNKEKATAEMLDLQDAQARLDSHTTIKAHDYAEIADADILFVTSGNIYALTKNSGNRWAEFKDTKQIVQDIAPKIKASGFHGVLIDVMNPCDCITYYLQQATGLPQNQVFGTGTFLDTARMQKVVGETFDVDPKNVTGYTLGEHGASQFTAWSTVQVNGLAIESYQAEKQLNFDDMEEKARFGGWTVHSGKGYTNFAIATCAIKLSQAVLSDAKLACPCSSFNEKYGTYVGQPGVIGKNGVEYVTTLPLTDEEEEKFKASANFIRERFETLPKVK